MKFENIKDKIQFIDWLSNLNYEYIENKEEICIRSLPIDDIDNRKTIFEFDKKEKTFRISKELAEKSGCYSAYPLQYEDLVIMKYFLKFYIDEED